MTAVPHYVKKGAAEKFEKEMERSEFNDGGGSLIERLGPSHWDEKKVLDQWNEMIEEVALTRAYLIVAV